MHQLSSAASTRRTRWALLPALALVLALSACGDGDDSGTAAGGPSEPASATSGSASSPGESGGEEDDGDEGEPEQGVTIEVTISGHEVSPNGERVEVQVGEPVTFLVTADAPGSLHVHSTPEQEIAYEAGQTKARVTIEQPGVVEVESHEAHAVVVQLEAR